MKQSEKIDANLELLRQAVSLLERLTDSAYASIGGHVRHILEFYECLLDGFNANRIDYDARRRDRRVELDRAVAIARILQIMGRLENSALLRGDAVIRVRMEDSQDWSTNWSTTGRELQFVRSHTIHHFALIAMILPAHGVTVDRGFGVSPATLRYRAA